MRRIRCQMLRECSSSLVFGAVGEGEVLLADNGCFARSGGVSIIGGGGKIDINNTLEERLRLCETDALPSVRTTLFGKNENRKFYD